MAQSTEHMLLPVEILARIFRAACCTDARFHFTLRLVSRLCHDIARPLKYCSLFIHGSEHLRFIVRQLTAYPANIPLVEHVAITDHCQPTRRDTPGRKSKPWPDRHPNHQMTITARPDSGVHRGEGGEGEFEREVKTFLDMVAPTLRTLHVAFYSPFVDIFSTYLEIFRPKNGRTYPNLHEVGFRGPKSRWYRYPPGTERTGLIPSKTGRKTFPQLKRLWLSGAASYSSGAFFADIAMACPLLTHLRLHEEHSYGTTKTIYGFIERFMRWHGVQLGDTEFIHLKPKYSWLDGKHRVDFVSVLQSNPLLGFPHLQRVVVDLMPRVKGEDRVYGQYCDIMQAIAQRRRDVVIKWCRECKRQCAPLGFVRDVFEKSVSGDTDTWEPENEEKEVEDGWKPLKMVLPAGGRHPLNPSFRGNIPLSPFEMPMPES